MKVVNMSRLLLLRHDPRTHCYHRNTDTSMCPSKNFNRATEPCHACGLEGGSNIDHLSTHLRTYIKDNYWWGSITFDQNLVMRVASIDCCKRCRYWSCKDRKGASLIYASAPVNSAIQGDKISALEYWNGCLLQCLPTLNILWSARTLKEEQHEGPHNGSNESVNQIGISSPPPRSRHFSSLLWVRGGMLTLCLLKDITQKGIVWVHDWSFV